MLHVFNAVRSYKSLYGRMLSSSTGAALCLSCASPTLVRGRRILGTPESKRVTLVWKETVLNEIQKEEKQFDADSIITRKERYLCKKCFYAYEKFAEKKEVGRIFSIVVDQMY